MSTANRQKLAHSADVRMHLSVDGHTMRIGHLAPDYIILDHPIDHPPADGEISMSLDGKESRWQVRLVEGLSASQAAARTPPISGDLDKPAQVSKISARKSAPVRDLRG